MKTESGDAPSPITINPWEQLRRFTSARIALGRAGTSLPTQAQLAFAMAHAEARNAVHHELDFDALEQDLKALGPTLQLKSAAGDRPTYLQRPDLGRRLDDASRSTLRARPDITAANAAAANAAASNEAAADNGTPGEAAPDLAIVIADGLSSLAIERNALPFLQILLPAIKDGWTVGPISLVRNARVAIGDEIGEALAASMVVVLIGERPGLSSPDSMGIYLTWKPRKGLTDEARNCISNVRSEGLAYPVAVHKLRYLMEQARERQLSGVALKDESDALLPRQDGGTQQFLLGPTAPR